MEEYISIREAAEKWNVSERRVNQYCSDGRILGAQRIGRSWAIPAGAEKPGDPRKVRKFHVAFLQDGECLLPEHDLLREYHVRDERGFFLSHRAAGH